VRNYAVKIEQVKTESDRATVPAITSGYYVCEWADASVSTYGLA